MVFDDNQRRQAGGSPPGRATGRQQGRRGVGGIVAGAGAAGAGLGVGSAAGLIAGDDAVAFIREQTGDQTTVNQSGLADVRERIEAVEDAARAASYDVFESRAAEIGAEAPTGIAESAGIIGNSLPPLPIADEGEEAPEVEIPGTPPGGQPPVGRPDPEGVVPTDGESPASGDRPATGRPQPEATPDLESETPATPSLGGLEADEGDLPVPSGAPSAPPPAGAPDAPAPTFASPPPSAPPAGSGGETDQVVDEGPAPPPFSPAPSGPGNNPPVTPATAAPPESGEDVAGTPGSGEELSPPETGAPDLGDSEGFDVPPSTDAPAPGTAGESATPVSSEPATPPVSGGVPDVSPPPVSSESDVSGAPVEPDTGSESSGFDEPSTPQESDSGEGSSSDSSDAPSIPVGSSGSTSDDSDSSSSSSDGSESSSAYPYVYQWDDDGNWVDVAMQNDQGSVYYLRYQDDGTVYYLNEDGEYEQVQGENLPHLLYVDEYGVAYFSKMQYQHTVYFSVDTDGDFDWVEHEDIPGYDDAPAEDDYDYPRVIDYEPGEDAWALVEMEDGRLVKYYDDGGAYWVDEYGNETAISGLQVPTLLYVDNDGDAYFRVYLETEGEYRYYTVDQDGGVEYVHDYDVPDYEEPPYEPEYEYPRVVQWDAGEGWVIVQNEDGDSAKIYEDGQGYPVDEYGEPLQPNGYYYPDLIQVDDNGNAYFRIGDPGDYSYYMIDYDGGVEYVSYEDIPEYDEPPYEEGDDYPLVTLWDHDAGWVVVQEDEGHYSKYYTDGNVENVDQYGNELPPNGLAPELGQLLYIEAGGDAYFRSGEQGNYEYYTVDQYGNVEYIHYSDVPGYEPEPGEIDEYEYPRVIEWDADGGWVIIEDENGDYVKYYENRPPHFVDAEGNEIPGDYPDQARLLQVDQYGNAYFQYVEADEYVYIQVDGDGGIENVDPNDIPDFEYEELDDQYDYPRSVEWDADAGWVTLETDLGYQIKLYENGDAYFVDDYGNETPVGDYPMPALLQIDEYGTAYLQEGEGPNYTYFTIDQDGGIEYVQYEDIPGYEDLELPYEDGYPRLLEQYDGEPDWALVEFEDGRIIKYYADGGEYQIDPDGGETPVMTADHLIEVDQYGNAYFQHYDVDGHHQYYTIGADGGTEYIDPSEIPGYEVPDDYQPYEYPRAIEWDADAGWVTIDDGDGHYVKYYEDGHQEAVDEQGNPVAPNGANIPDARLIYVDDDGNAYFEDYDAGGNISGYYTIDYDGGVEAVDPNDIPGYESPDPVDGDGYLPYGMPPYLVFGEGYEYEAEYADPEAAGYELISATPEDDPTQWQYVGPNGERVIINQLDDSTYQYAYQSDPNAQPGDWEMVMNVTTDEDGNYQSYDAVGGEYYEEWYDETPPDGDYEYPRTYLWDTDDNWVVLEVDDGLYIRYDEYRPPYYVDENGNEITGQGSPGAAEHLLYVDEGGNAYFRSGQPGDYHYGLIDNDGGITEVNPDDIPDYDYEDVPAEDNYQYPRVIEWDAGQGWAMIQLDTGYQVRFYENGSAYYVDGQGNEIPAPEYSGQYQLVQVDAQGNAYIRSGETYYQVDVDGGSEPVDLDDIPGYDPDAVVEGYYDAAWAEHYDTGYGYDHPYDLYGQPDPPGENQNPNVYVFGGGRAMVVHNADGTETITWYSEGGYQDGYVEYKATVEYEDDHWTTETEAIPVDYIPQYGIHAVDGSPVYDPYHPDAPWGEPDSVTVLDNRVIAIWETDEGQIRSEWYRDGSDYREVRYPDGLVISWGGDDWQYEAPDDWVPPEYGEVMPDDFDADGYLPDGAPEYFGDEMWVNPETDARFVDEGHNIDPDGTVFRFYQADLDGNGTYDYQITVVEQPDGSSYVDYYNMETQLTDARIQIEQNADGYYDGYNPTIYYEDGGVPPYVDDQVDQPEYDAQYVYNLLPDGLPPTFEGGYANPEYTPEYDYHHSETYGDVTVHVFDHAGGYSMVVQENPDGTQTMYWHDEQVSALNPPYTDGAEARVTVYADGQYNTEYWHDGQWDDNPPEYDEPEAYDFDADGYLPDGSPPYFMDERWPNPEADERFQYVNGAETPDGGYARIYSADLDGDGTWDYQVTVIEHPDGQVQLEYNGMNGLEARFDVTQNGDGYYQAYDYNYYVDDPQGAGGYEGLEADIVFEADGYLPDGTPAYFEDERWPNPEADERFQLTTHTETQDGGYARLYNADLDGDGSWDYQVTVIENPDGQVEVEYAGANGLEARFYVTQDAGDDYQAYDHNYYVDDPQGIGGYAEAQVSYLTAEETGVDDGQNGEAADDQSDDAPDSDGMVAPEYVFYGLPGYFSYGGMDYPSPAQGDWEYEGVQSVGGMNMHQFSYGNYTVMIQDGQGVDRTVYVDDHSTGDGVDAGYILRANGDVEVHPEWAVAEQESLPAEEAEEPEASDEPADEDLEFLTEEEQQVAEEDGVESEAGSSGDSEEEPLSFNGPETGNEESPQIEAVADNGAVDETIEPVEIAEPVIIEPEQELDPVASAVAEDDGFDDDGFEDDDDDDGTGL